MATPAVANQNPGNLKDPNTGGFQKFSDPAEGKAALYNDLTAKMTGKSSTGLTGDSSLLEFAKTYAPASDKNDPVQYAANLANKLGVSPDEKIGNLTSRIDDFASAVASNEDPSVQYKQTSQTGTGYNPTPFSKPQAGQFDFSGLSTETIQPEQPKEKGVIQNLVDRTNQIGTSVKQTMGGTINPLSGILQTVGGVAGGIGDITSGVLENTPIIGSFLKGIEGIIGKGVESFASTETGKSVIKSVIDWAKQNPEQSGNLQAGINIVSAYPILRGIGLVKNLAMDGASIALKNTAEKVVTKDLEQVVTRTVGGRNFIKNVPDAVKTIVEKRALPDIVDGRYATKEASEIIHNSISEINQNKLQPILEQVSKNQAVGQDLATLKNLAIKQAENDVTLKEAGMVPQALQQIEKRFNGWFYSYGKNVDIATENRLKIGTGKFTDWRTPEGSADKAIYHALQTNIEDTAKKNGFENLVHEANDEMKKLIKAQDVLQYIDTKKPAENLMEKITGKIPLVGKPAKGIVSGKSVMSGVLKRTSPTAEKQTVKGSLQKTAGLVGGLSVQSNQNKAINNQ
jgi:hypothetical protein